MHIFNDDYHVCDVYCMAHIYHKLCKTPVLQDLVLVSYISTITNV